MRCRSSSTSKLPHHRNETREHFDRRLRRFRNEPLDESGIGAREIDAVGNRLAQERGEAFFADALHPARLVLQAVLDAARARERAERQDAIGIVDRHFFGDDRAGGRAGDMKTRRADMIGELDDVLDEPLLGELVGSRESASRRDRACRS